MTHSTGSTGVGGTGSGTAVIGNGGTGGLDAGRGTGGTGGTGGGTGGTAGVGTGPGLGTAPGNGGIWAPGLWTTNGAAHGDRSANPPAAAIDAIVEAIEERVLAEIERRGGRYQGMF
jgi:hypothetical protein